jgi:ubiquinone/menaquinone biosynthesis C-methylase UbiE
VAQDDHVAAARAVYDASAARYVEFVGTEISSATEAALDRSLLTTFVDLVAAEAPGRVADVGCGPGRVAALLAEHGLDVVGVDVSAAMLDVARTAHPDVTFEEGTLDHLPIETGSLAGAVCWYSIIFTPPERLGDAFVELARVLRPGGHLLVAFQAGDGDAVRRTNVHGTGFSLTSFRHRPSDVARRLEIAGLEARDAVVREPELDHETTPQAFVHAARG